MIEERKRLATRTDLSKIEHERLDKAVHAAYGWKYPLDAGEVLARLVALNLERSPAAAA